MVNFNKIWGKALFCLVFCAFVGSSLLAILDGQPTQYFRIFESFFLSITFWAVVLVLVGDVFWIYVLSIPVALLVPMEIWQRLVIGKPTSMHFMAFAMETTWVELINFLSTHGRSVAYIIVPWVMVYTAAIHSAWQMRMSVRGSFLSVGAFFLSGLVAVHYIFQGSPAWMMNNDEVTALDGRVADGWSRQWEDVFPINIGIAAQRYYLEQRKLGRIHESMKKMDLGAQLVDDASAPELVVLVIGESSVPSRWSLFGYDQVTTPRLQSMDQLVAFENVVSVSTATRTAVPAAISQQPVLLPTGHVNRSAEPSIIQSFRQAGYYTYWFSNQAPFGKFDSSIGIYSREADQAKFLNPSTYESRGSLDEELLNPLQEAIDRPGRKLVVLHTLGSHFDYSLRYPEIFRKFGRYRNIETDSGLSDEAEKISNEYNNSILYTDHVLSEVIERVRLKQNNAVVAYFSDHGEDIPGNGCRYRGVNRRTAFSYTVPVFFWLSESYIKQHDELWQKLHANRMRPYTTRAVSSTLMSLGHVDKTKSASEHESFLLKSDLANMPRMVALSDFMVDYDAAISKNKCEMSGR